MQQDRAFEVDIPFLAPVPRGNEVLVARLRRDASSTDERFLVHDRTGGVVYCDEHLAGPLGRALQATHDPLASLARWTWVVEIAVVGRAAGAVAVSSNTGEVNVARTLLFVVPAAATPYR
jgi:hypothetical protein